MRYVLWAVLAAASGCTFVYKDDIDDKKQCSSDADCNKLSGRDGALVCQSNVCVPNLEALAECDKDEDCTFYGKGSTCGANKECVPPGFDAGTSDAGPEPVACKVDKDCASLGKGFLCGFDKFCYEKWGCVEDDLDWPKPPVKFTYQATLRSLSQPEDPSLLGNNIEARACVFGDTACENPIARGGADENKRLSITFDGFSGEQFNGSIRITDATPLAPGETAEKLAFLPSYIHFGGGTRLVGDLYAQDRVLLIDSDRFALFAAIGATANPDQGTVIMLAYDCGGRSAANVVMSTAGVPDFKFIAVANESGIDLTAPSTTADGIGVLLNIPGGQRKFVLTDEATSKELGSVTPAVVAGAINYVQFYPRYSALKKWIDESKKPNTLP